MDHKNATEQEKINVESLKQRLVDIPLVHKPSTNESDQLPFSSEILKQTKSCNSYFYQAYEKELHAKGALNVIPGYFYFTPKPSSTPSYAPSSSTLSSSKAKKIRSEDSEIATRNLQIPPNQWLVGGTLGSRNSILVFRASALAGVSKESIRSKPGHKLHVTYKVLQAETKLLAKLLDCHGISEVSFESNDFNLLWTGNHPKPGVFRALNNHQRINHFPRSYELTRKDRLYKNIERMQHSKGLRNFDFIPQTFIMPGDFKELCSVHYRVKGPWIVKPVASSRGRGIFIVENPHQVPLDEPVVVAKYLCNPLLINGHKCDLRLYIAVTSYDPLIIYIYEEGLVRFATVKYDTSHKQLWNPCMHLCNYSINKYHSDYIKSDDPAAENVGHKWTLSALLRHLKNLGKDTVQLMSQIEDIVVKAIITSANSIIAACQMFVPNQNNCFELFGFDILIDADLKPWLLEVNLSPSLGCDSPLDVRLKSAMLADLLTLIGLPAVDPILKPMNHCHSPSKTNMMKMKLGACRRVHSAEGLSQVAKKQLTGRLTNSTLYLTPEENRLIKLAKTQFERRGGWVRVFPTADSWFKYSQYLDPASGIPVSALPQTTSCHLVVHHNFNHLLHSHLFPEVPKIPVNKGITPSKGSFQSKGSTQIKGIIQSKGTTSSKWISPSKGVIFAKGPNNNIDVVNIAVGQRHSRYQRQLNREYATTTSLEDKQSQNKSQGEEFKAQVCHMLKSGKILTQGEIRKTFSQYLQCILRRISTDLDSENDSHTEVVLNFLQKASTYLRTPFAVKAPSVKLNGKDRAALIAKQLNDFLYLYNRDTELYSDTLDRFNSVPYSLFSQFLETARESDLEEVLTIQTLRSLPQRVENTNCGFQGLLKCFPNTLNSSKTNDTNQTAKKTVAKPS